MHLPAKAQVPEEADPSLDFLEEGLGLEMEEGTDFGFDGETVLVGFDGRCLSVVS